MDIGYPELLNKVTAKAFEPFYFLQGQEPFFIDNILDLLAESVIEESQRSFNQYVLYGKETSMEQVVSTARKFPMMGDRQLILVKEAQEMRGWHRETDQNLLMNYLNAPVPSTILAFGYKYKTLDKRTKLAKAIKDKGLVMTTKSLYDNEVPGWISAYAQALGVSITKGAVQMLAENIGNDLKRIANEFEKLKPNVSEGQAIDEALIDEYVGISKAYNTFELQRAIAHRDTAKAFQIIKYFSQNPSANPLILTLFSLYNYFSKLVLVHTADSMDKQSLSRRIGVNPFFVAEYISASQQFPLAVVLRNLDHIYEADLQSKGIGAMNKKEMDVLMELVYKLLA